MKKNNKGFTLVELIVVLVILAILAAILVPALLGYIDRAREKQYVLNARSAYTATQAELSALYGAGYSISADGAELTAKSATISATADTGADTHFYVALGGDSSKGAISANHERYTIHDAYYTQEVNGETIYTVLVNGKTWETTKTKPTAPSGDWIQAY